MIISGDFNLGNINWNKLDDQNNALTQYVVDFISQTQLKQHITIPTRDKNIRSDLL